MANKAKYWMSLVAIEDGKRARENLVSINGHVYRQSFFEINFKSTECRLIDDLSKIKKK